MNSERFVTRLDGDTIHYHVEGGPPGWVLPNKYPRPALRCESCRVERHDDITGQGRVRLCLRPGCPYHHSENAFNRFEYAMRVDASPHDLCRPPHSVRNGVSSCVAPPSSARPTRATTSGTPAGTTRFLTRGGPDVPKALTKKRPLKVSGGGPSPAPREAKPPQKKWTVVRDTREKAGHGWSFAESQFWAGTEVRKLDTGDYTVVGLEHVVTVDRKGALSEFAGNLTQARFERELERMASFAVPVVLLEFSFEDLMRWPEGSGIPRAKQQYMKLTKHVLLARYWQIRLKYPHVDFMFAGDYGKEAVASLFKRVIEKHG